MENDEHKKSTTKYRKRIVPADIFLKRRLMEEAKQKRQIELVRAFWRGEKLTPYQRSKALTLARKSELIENKNIFTKKNKLFRAKTAKNTESK